MSIMRDRLVKFIWSFFGGGLWWMRSFIRDILVINVVIVFWCVVFFMFLLFIYEKVKILIIWEKKILFWRN